MRNAGDVTGVMGVMRPFRPAVLLVLAAGIAAAAWLVWSGLGRPGMSDATPEPSAHEAQGPDDPRDRPWWRVEPGPRGTTVVIGTMRAGETAALAVGGDEPVLADGAISVGPMVVGARDGKVVMLERHVAGSVISAVTAATGERRELVRSTDLVFDAELAGGEVAFVTVDPADGAPIGVWTVAIDGGDQRLLHGLTTTAPALRPVAIVPWITNLVASEDGRTLALLRCVALDCELRVLDRQTGATVRHALPFGQQPAAIVGHFAVMENACADIDCDVRLLDLDSGEARDLPRAANGPAWTATRIGGRDTELVVMRMGAPAAGGAAATVEIVDLAAMAARQLRVEARSVQPVDRTWNVGVELPDGAFLALVSLDRDDPTRLVYVLVDTATGSVTPVPELGRPMAQG